MARCLRRTCAGTESDGEASEIRALWRPSVCLGVDHPGEDTEGLKG